MIKLIIGKCIKNSKEVNNPNVREQYISLSGYIGIISNVILFTVKLAIGLTINSIAVISDAFNNMTDISSSAISIVSAKISSQPPDGTHPHGHGRFEYIGSLVVAFIIFSVGFQLLRKSYEKILNPEIVRFSPIILGILILSVLVKLWMFSYNRYIAKTIKSSINKAAAYDSISDSVATTLVIFSMILGIYTDFPIDGGMGILIALLIMYSGFDVARDTANRLLGKAPEEDVVKEIHQIVNAGDYVINAHGLEVHEYGPGRIVASIDVEVSDSVNIVDAHTSIDQLEKQIKREMGIDLSVHIDPVSTDEAKIKRVKKEVASWLKQAEMNIDIRVVRVAEAEKKTVVTLEIQLLGKVSPDEVDGIKNTIINGMEDEFHDYHIVIKAVRQQSVPQGG
ncbi:MAG: cation diffusion facilitator family transporter [Bacillota bacterium]|nr:cation diffusion facilitator family transporter [Bacillota bacterium]MDW7676993.1 cation diffusion facilitator family transporter [Bacillota bacterium]